MGRKVAAAGLGVAWLLVGLVGWVIGVIGIAQGLEDRCLHVAVDHSYGGSLQSASVWPPRFTCELTGPDDAAAADPFEVHQPGAAVVRTGWTVGFPVAWVVLGSVAYRSRFESDRPRLQHRQR